MPPIPSAPVFFGPGLFRHRIKRQFYGSANRLEVSLFLPRILPITAWVASTNRIAPEATLFHLTRNIEAGRGAGNVLLPYPWNGG